MKMVIWRKLVVIILSSFIHFIYQLYLIVLIPAGLAFEVAEGGFLDIDIKIYSPEGKTIHEGERESNGRYTFPASMDGVYTYCFSNKMSTMTPKLVMFTMEVGDDAKSEHHAKNAEEGEQKGKGRRIYL